MDEQKVSLNDLENPFHRFVVVILHAGNDIFVRGKNYLEVNLLPSTILGDPSLHRSPFYLKVKITTLTIEAMTDHFSTIPALVHFGEPIVLSSWNGLISEPRRIVCPVAPLTNLTINENGLTIIREITGIAHDIYQSPKNLLELIESSIRKSVSKKCAVLFSGGLDSTLLLKLIIDSGRKPLAVSVGLSESHDLMLSERVARLIGAERVTVELSQEKLFENARYVRDMLGIKTLMEVSLAVLFFTGALEALRNGRRQLIAGQGADELFGGYLKYLRTYEEDGPAAADNLMKLDFARLWSSGLVRDYSATALGGCLLTLPYLDPDIIRIVTSLPISAKIKPPLRKVILRKICREAGLPEEVCMYDKKAAQYGSGIEKLLRKWF